MQEKKLQDQFKEMRREEYSKATPHDEMKEDLLNELIADPKQNKKEIENQMESMGMGGLSRKDRHQVVTQQLIEAELQRYLYSKKLKV